MARERPNILFLVADSWRGDVLGHLGDPAARTPNLDRLVAGRGVSFRHTFAQATNCVPSRCAMMTGWYPHVRGHRSMSFPLQRDEPSLLKRLKSAGYHVWWGCGKNDTAPNDERGEHCTVLETGDAPFSAYFDGERESEWRGEPEGKWFYSFLRGRNRPKEGRAVSYDPDWSLIEKADAFIRSGAERAEPWCAYIDLFFPHPPYAVEDPWYSAIDRTELPPRIAPDECEGKAEMLAAIRERQNLDGLSEADWRELRAVYYGMASRVDAQLGKLLAALEASGQAEHTWVVFTSDHGDYTGDYGIVEKSAVGFEDALARVPLVIAPPRGDPRVVPGVRDALVELIDLPATVGEIARIDVPWPQFGRSLLPLVRAEGEHRAAVFCEGGRLPEETADRYAERLPRERSRYWPRVSAQHENPRAHAKAYMVRTRRWKYVYRPCTRDELYDLESDPGERRNRIAEPGLADTARALRERLLAHLSLTSDVVSPVDDGKRQQPAFGAA